MKEIDGLYAKLIINDSGSPILWGIDSKVRTKIFKKIFDDLDNFRKKQENLKPDSNEYKDLDLNIRLRLLKEIQIIIDEYIIAKESQDLDRWTKMYGDIERYKRNFFYYRMGKDYEDSEKVLVDYKLA